MHFCFIIEEAYKYDPMPMVVVYQLLQWGHSVDVLEPQDAVVCLTDMSRQDYDAYVLKTLADGPGLSILEAAEAVGIATVNNPRAIRLVRDKAVATAFAHAHGLPIPSTYFVAHPGLLDQIPSDEYPLVIKPSNGSSCQGIYRVNSPTELAKLQMERPNDHFLLAQRYVENAGFDIKVYVTGREVYAAIARQSPLHGTIEEVFIPLSKKIRRLALDVGMLFGLDIYGIDIVEGPDGPVVLDINDFPSFGGVPRAVIRVAEYILHATRQAEMRRGHKRQESKFWKPFSVPPKQIVQEHADPLPSLTVSAKQYISGNRK